jgi:predicted DsbA family dithiol-disulfide isomerase
MADATNTVDFYWDMVCPWCWITSRWMVDVSQQKAIDVNWKFFSLRKINEGRDLPERFRISHAIGLRALRVAAAVRKDYGNEAVGKLYTVMGTRRHHDKEDVGVPETLAAVLSTCGLPVELAAAADDDTWDQVIEADMAQAKAKAGTDVGVPLIVLDGKDRASLVRSSVQPPQAKMLLLCGMPWSLLVVFLASMSSSARGKRVLSLAHVQRSERCALQERSQRVPCCRPPCWLHRHPAAPRNSIPASTTMAGPVGRSR